MSKKVRKDILRSIVLVISAVAVVLIIAWTTGPFYYHFAGIRLVTLYSFFQLLAAAGVSFLACRILETESSVNWRKNISARPFFIAAIGFLLLGVDEIFSLYENIDKLIHHILFMEETPWTDHIDDAIMLAYGLVAIFFLKDFVREFKKHPYMLVLIAAGFFFFFVMVFLDFATNNEERFKLIFGLSGESYSEMRHRCDVYGMIEDSAKLCGEALFLSAFLAAFINIRTRLNKSVYSLLRKPRTT